MAETELRSETNPESEAPAVAPRGIDRREVRLLGRALALRVRAGVLANRWPPSRRGRVRLPGDDEVPDEPEDEALPSELAELRVRERRAERRLLARLAPLARMFGLSGVAVRVLAVAVARQLRVLLGGAVAVGAAGINALLYGVTGVGKTALDDASLRRFAFKIRFDPLRPDQRRAMLAVLVGAPPPSVLIGRLDALDLLTPGDFTAAARRLRTLHPDAPLDPATLVDRLAEENALKRGARRRVGFGR